MASMTLHTRYRTELLADGASDRELRALYTRQGWTRIRPGAYLPPDVISAQERHRELIFATMRVVSPDSVLSHQSACVTYGLPVWGIGLDQIHLTRDRQSGGRIGRAIHLHSAPLHDIRNIAGLPVVSPARALADVARTAALEQGVALGDAMLRQQLCSATEIAELLEYARRRHGYSRLRTALGLLDGRSESVGESRSRIILRGLGIMELQPAFYDGDGNFIGRTDFFFPQYNVIGEFDGKVKYGKYLRPGEESGDAVFREKRREDRLRALGWTVVRWTWDELSRPGLLRSWLQQAFHRASLGAVPGGSYVLAPADLAGVSRPHDVCGNRMGLRRLAVARDGRL